VRIFFDDSRQNPNKTYNLARTYEDCVEFLDLCPKDIEFIDLDYNLGRNSEHDGLDVLVYMNEQGIQPTHINIHSSHERGSPMMVEYAKTHFPNSLVTDNMIYK
jgi:hypothetical protein